MTSTSNITIESLDSISSPVHLKQLSNLEDNTNGSLLGRRGRSKLSIHLPDPSLKNEEDLTEEILTDDILDSIFENGVQQKKARIDGMSTPSTANYDSDWAFDAPLKLLAPQQQEEESANTATSWKRLRTLLSATSLFRRGLSTSTSDNNNNFANKANSSGSISYIPAGSFRRATLGSNDMFNATIFMEALTL